MKTTPLQPVPPLDGGVLIEVLWDTFGVFTRRDCLWCLAGLKPMPRSRHADETLYRLVRQGWLSRAGRGREAKFTITAAGQERLARRDPPPAWAQPWDGRWRVLVYDLPEQRRRDRFQIWRALRRSRLGLLQRSVWVWPHDLAPIVSPLLQGRITPDYFCGFTAGDLFLGSHAEVVRSSWDWKRIGHEQQAYLTQDGLRRTALTRARDAATAMRIVLAEARAYRDAFQWDPLLPRALCPAQYRGFRVEQAHREFRTDLRRRAQPGVVTL